MTPQILIAEISTVVFLPTADDDKSVNPLIQHNAIYCPHKSLTVRRARGFLERSALYKSTLCLLTYRRLVSDEVSLLRQAA